MDETVKVTCKNCGRQAPASEFTLDPIFGKVVCRNCVKERKSGIAKKDVSRLNKSKNEAESLVDEGDYEQIVHDTRKAGSMQSSSKPADWDSVDEELERSAREKDQKKSPITVLPDGRLLVTCRKCKFQFKYNKQKGVPNTCPYCATPVSLTSI